MTYYERTDQQSAAIAAFSNSPTHAGQIQQQGTFTREVHFRESFDSGSGKGNKEAAFPLILMLAGLGLMMGIAFWPKDNQQQKIDQLNNQLAAQQAAIAEFKACASKL